MASSVYDASAFYAGIPFASPVQGITTTIIFEEIKHIKKNHGALDTLLETGRLKIQDPDSSSTYTITSAAKKTGDIQKLSKADISAVALAYELKTNLVTDDFAVSNLAKNLGLQVTPIMTKGIKDVGKWIHYCAGCKKEFTGEEFCPNCGNKLNRKLLKR
ncbi:MAG: NOB1 family endonuclease [Candidatus Nitrosotenuis sp.]